MEPSTYQKGIFAWIKSGRGHGVVNAVAGSGKTTTIVMAALRIVGAGIFLAFGNAIARALGVKLQGTAMSASTVHSHGAGAVRATFKGAQVNRQKYSQAVKVGLTRCADNGGPIGKLVAETWPAGALLRLLELCRLHMVDPDEGSIARLVSHFDLTLDPQLYPFAAWLVRDILAWGKDWTHEIDFCDMLWFPVVHNLPVKQYDWVFVDECQDLSPLALELIAKTIAPGGRLLAVGDPSQAIMAFAGADSDSFEKLKARFEATELPLSVCYRCPTSHLELARKIVPHIEAREGAPEGTVTELEYDKLVTTVGEGDYVICRLTAPLVALCYTLIRSRVRATVLGRSIGEGLIAALKQAVKFAGADFRFPSLPAHIREWAEHRKGVILAKSGDPEDPMILKIDDQAESLMAVIEMSNATDVATLITAIEGIFSDTRSSVTLSTVHKAKGLEADRVFILGPELMPFPKAKQPHQIKQEMNLKYVALTRAKRDLFMVPCPPSKRQKD